MNSKQPSILDVRIDSEDEVVSRAAEGQGENCVGGNIGLNGSFQLVNSASVPGIRLNLPKARLRECETHMVQRYGAANRKKMAEGISRGGRV